MDELNKLKIFNKLFFQGKFIIILKNKFGKFVIRKAINYMPNEFKKKLEFELIKNINNNAYYHKDKNRVKKFLVKLQGDDDNFVNHNNKFNYVMNSNYKNKASF